MEKFLQETKYIDFHADIIQYKIEELFVPNMTQTEKVKTAYKFVRDKIDHSFDCKTNIITAKASNVLLHKTGICHAKANLLAALLRSQDIPTGFCFQHLTLLDDDSLGYCVHTYNAVFLNSKWIKLDARGNRQGVNAQISVGEPILAFANREKYDEYFWSGIYSSPHIPTMKMLEKADSIQYIFENIPDTVDNIPDISE